MNASRYNGCYLEYVFRYFFGIGSLIKCTQYFLPRLAPWFGSERSLNYTLYQNKKYVGVWADFTIKTLEI